MKRTYIALIILILLVAGFTFMGKEKVEAPVVSNQENTAPTTSVATSSVKEFMVTGDNFSFKPAVITDQKGDNVKVTFKNTQGFHDFVIDEYGVATKQAQAPDTEVIEFTATKAGTFEYYCSVGSHRMMGMKGTLIVQ